MTDTDRPEFDTERRDRIRALVLAAEKAQLHLDKPHGIIPEITEIVENEIDPVEEYDHESDGGELWK